MSKCPVCDYPLESPKSVTANGVTVRVCCDECVEKVRSAPDRYTKGKPRTAARRASHS